MSQYSKFWNQGRDDDLPGILVHDDGHTAKIQSVSLGREAFAESISDMVGAQERGNDDQYVRGGQSEGDGVPRCEDVSLEFEVSILAAGEVGSRVAEGRLCRLDIGREVSAASHLIGSISECAAGKFLGLAHSVLDPQSALGSKLPTPLQVDLAFQIESLLLVADVSRSDQKT